MNVKGREPIGIIGPCEEYERTRDQIVEGLKGITIDGKKPIKGVRKREEVWWASEKFDPTLLNSKNLPAIFGLSRMLIDLEFASPSKNRLILFASYVTCDQVGICRFSQRS